MWLHRRRPNSPRPAIFRLAGLTASLLLLLGLLLSCTPPPSGGGEQPPTPPPPTSLTGISLQKLASGVVKPTTIATAGDQRLFVAERAGKVRLVDQGALVARPFLDISDEVKSDEGEQGLLGLAFPPDHADTGYFYAYYTDNDGHGVLSRFQVAADDPNFAPAGSERQLVRLDQVTEWHNGGQLAFGPADGYLYWAVGDGGEDSRAQELDSAYGKILRLDVSGDGAPSAPSDNPFLDEGSMAAWIWAYGLRNPWRFAFDAPSGALYIADVGEDGFEEVNVQPMDSGGLNYGWPILEGDSCYPPEESETCDRAGLTAPAFTYPHPADSGASVTGGYVYHGTKAPGLVGAYVFADFISGRISAARRAEGGWSITPLADLHDQVATFGQGADGSLYVATYGTGIIYELSQAPD